MTQMIQFLPTSGATGGVRAVAPVVHQSTLEIAVGAGAAAQDLLAAIASGQAAAASGQVVNTGCYDVELTIEYVTGADCDSCTVDTLTLEEITVVVPKNSAFPLPEGLVASIAAVTVDSTGAPVANTTVQTVKYYGSYAPGCGGAVLVP